jgi:hypothetical protein
MMACLFSQLLVRLLEREELLHHRLLLLHQEEKNQHMFYLL